MTNDHWATPAAPDVARAWYAQHMPLGAPGQSGNPHRVVWTDWVEKARLAKEAAALAAEVKASRSKPNIPTKSGENRIGHARPTMSRNLDTDEVTEYRSADYAAKMIGVCRQTMDKALKSGRHIAFNFRVWYADKPEPIHAVRFLPYRCTLENIETGEVVTRNNYTEMAKVIGCTSKAIQEFFKRDHSQVHGWKRPNDIISRSMTRRRRPIYSIDQEGNRTDYPNVRQASISIFTDEYTLNDIISGRNNNHKRQVARIYYADTGEVIYEPALDKRGKKV